MLTALMHAFRDDGAFEKLPLRPDAKHLRVNISDDIPQRQSRRKCLSFRNPRESSFAYQLSKKRPRRIGSPRAFRVWFATVPLALGLQLDGFHFADEAACVVF